MISDLLHRTLKGAPQIILSFEFTSVSSTLLIVTKVKSQLKIFVPTEKRSIMIFFYTLLHNQKYLEVLQNAQCVFVSFWGHFLVIFYSKHHKPLFG